jgi:heptosyltransferase-1
MNYPNVDAVKKILFIQTKGGIGDLLTASPVTEAVAGRFSQASIHCWVNPGFQAILEGNPFVTGFFKPDPSGLLSRNVRAVRNERFDLAIMPWGTAEHAWTTFLSGIPIRVGQDDRLLYSFLFTHKIRRRTDHGDTDSHMVDCLLDYARNLGCQVEGLRPRIWLTDDERAKGRNLLASMGIGEADRIIGMHVGKGLNISPDRWPVDKFAEIGKLIANQPGFKLVLTGGSAEKEAVDETERRIGIPVVNLAGKTDLRILAAVLSQIDAFICPDSGPGHMAAAVDTPVVSIFALKSDFPNRWRPFGDQHRVIRVKDPACDDKCVKETCPYFKCLLGIDVNEVASAAIELAQRK